MRLILDCGSGASLPDAATAFRFVDEVAKRDGHKHEIVFKAQLFEEAPPNTPLDWEVFDALYDYAAARGYQCTSSVFDKRSLGFLLEHDIPFVKIACRPDLYWLEGEVPRRVPVYISYTGKVPLEYLEDTSVDMMYCVRKYPAEVSDYPQTRRGLDAISDHTVGWQLFQEHTPHAWIWEKHLKLPDTTGPDAGPWAVTPDELAEVIS